MLDSTEAFNTTWEDHCLDFQNSATAIRLFLKTKLWLSLLAASIEFSMVQLAENNMGLLVKSAFSPSCQERLAQVLLRDIVTSSQSHGAIFCSWQLGDPTASPKRTIGFPKERLHWQGTRYFKHMPLLVATRE